jgi:cytochrome c-type biogenesis protein CcmH/NrfG
VFLGLCQAKTGRPGFAAQAFRQAVKYDPDNWRYHYELASVQGAAGIDPRPELQTAHRLNPHNIELNDLLASIPKGSSATWDLELTTPGGATGNTPP